LEFDQEKVNDIISKKYEDLLKEIEKSLKYEENNMFFACKVIIKVIFENIRIQLCMSQMWRITEYKDNAYIIVELLHKKAAYESTGISKRKNLSYIN
jgi:transcription initiation factor TFIIE subunit alpha